MRDREGRGGDEGRRGGGDEPGGATPGSPSSRSPVEAKKKKKKVSHRGPRRRAHGLPWRGERPSRDRNSLLSFLSLRIHFPRFQFYCV